MSRANLATLVADFEARSDLAIVARRGLRTERTSYRQLARLSRRFAAELQRRGIQRGERVILWGDNSASWVGAFFGCVLRGVLPVPLDPGSTPDFVARVTADVRPSLLLQNHGTELNFSQLAQQLPDQCGEAVPGLGSSDPLQIVFTSGTTAEPKGIIHTHGNVLASLGPIEAEAGRYLRYERLVHPIRILHTLPLSHVFGQFMGLWVPPVLGSEVHYENRLVAAELAEQIRRDRISVLAAVPRVLDLLQQHLLSTFPNLQSRLQSGPLPGAAGRWWKFRDVHRKLGFKFWAVVCGGAALSAEAEQFWNALGFAVIQGYGMTETTALISLNHPFRPARGTVGKVLPGREVRLSPDGEVLVRGETVSAATWQHDHIQQADSDWLATGDLGELDEAGNLHFRGRKKDVIVTTAGLNVYPEDVERALLAQPGVLQAAVFELEQGAATQITAALVLRPDSDLESIIRRANEGLAEYQRVSRWFVWPEADLPRTSTGKLLRREIVRRAPELAGTVDQQSQSLALDSLGRVALQSEWEARYGVTIDDAMMQRVSSEAELQQMILRQSSPPTRSTEIESSRRQNRHSYPKWPWNRAVQTLRSLFLNTVAFPLLRFLAKPKIVGSTARLSTPVLVVANHVTSYDVPFVLAALPSSLRTKVAVAMSGEMILDWRRGRNQGHWFLNLLGPLEYWVVTALFNIFPLPQRSGFRRSFRHAGEAVDRGYSVLIFPEGRRSPDGAPQPFLSGAGLLWNELNIPAIPVRLEGLGELKRKGSGWFRSGQITVTAGKAIQPNPQLPPSDSTKRLEAAVFNSASAQILDVNVGA